MRTSRDTEHKLWQSGGRRVWIQDGSHHCNIDVGRVLVHINQISLDPPRGGGGGGGPLPPMWG